MSDGINARLSLQVLCVYQQRHFLGGLCSLGCLWNTVVSQLVSVFLLSVINYSNSAKVKEQSKIFDHSKMKKSISHVKLLTIRLLIK